MTATELELRTIYFKNEYSTSLAKWLSVHLWTKWFWVQVQLHSLKLQILCLLRARSFLTFRHLYNVNSLWNVYVTWQNIQSKMLSKFPCVEIHKKQHNSECSAHIILQSIQDLNTYMLNLISSSKTWETAVLPVGAIIADLLSVHLFAYISILV